MREKAADQEWKSWKSTHPEELDYLRHLVREHCDSRLAEDSGWVPPNRLPWFLSSLDIDDEYMDLKPHALVTVRFDKSWPIERAYATLKGLKYKWLKGASAVPAEGFDYTPLNPHCHIFIPTGGLHKQNVVRQLAKKFCVASENVDVKESEDPDLFQTRQGYVRGEKQEKKASKIAQDRAYRDVHSIPHTIIFSH